MAVKGCGGGYCLHTEHAATSLLQAIDDRLADQLGIACVRVVVQRGHHPASVHWEGTTPDRLTLHPDFLDASTFPPEELEQHAEVVIAHELGEIKLGHDHPATSAEASRKRELACDDVAVGLFGEARVARTLDRVLVRDADPQSTHPSPEERIGRLLVRAETRGEDAARIRRTLTRFRGV